MLRLLLFLSGLAAFSLSAAAQTSEDSSAARTSAVYTPPPDTSRPAIRAGFAFYPFGLWAPTAGFGVGVGFEAEHLLFPRSELLVAAFPAQYSGVYTASFYTNSPYTDPVYGLLSARYETTGRQWFYGLGPTSALEDQIAVEQEDIEVEGRLGVYLVGRQLLLQPTLRWRQVLTKDFENREPDAFDRLSERSRRNLLLALGDPASGFPSADRQRSGVLYGLEALYDRRDRRFTTRRGLLATATARRFSESGTDLRFDRFGVNLYGFVPITASSVLALRTFAARTVNRGDAPIPFYLLPALDGTVALGFPVGRFYGNDLFLASAEYRFLVFNLLNVVGLEGVLAVSAASVYDNLWDQFTPRLTLDRSLPERLERFPLRPAIGVGGRLVSLYEDKVFLNGLVGFSAQGFGIVLFAFVQDLRVIRPLVR